MFRRIGHYYIVAGIDAMMGVLLPRVGKAILLVVFASLCLFFFWLGLH